MKSNTWNWSEDDLLALIEFGTQESIELEYKRCDALQKTDIRKKDELSKDVSAFANSAGGTLVYGIIENGHAPTQLDIGFDPNEVSKEWLEQVINSRIQRRIQGIRINQIPLDRTSPGRVAYAIHVPQSSNAPHQAADKRFYKRFNYQSVPMEEYEIRDVGNRFSGPDIHLKLAFNNGLEKIKLEHTDGKFFAPVGLTATVWNESMNAAGHAVFHFYLDERLKIHKAGSDVSISDQLQAFPNIKDAPTHQRQVTVLWDADRKIPLFSGIEAALPASPIMVSIPIDCTLLPIAYAIGAPGMRQKHGVGLIGIADGYATLKASTRSQPAPKSAL